MPSLREIYKKPDTLSDIVTTKGDLIVRNDSAPVRFAVGNDNQILVADSTTATGLRWGVVDIGFATVNTAFTTPAVGSTVTINVSTNRWVYPGMYVYIQDAGVYYVVSKSGSTSITVRNEYEGSNSLPGTNIGIARGIVPAGQRGDNGNSPYTVTTANFTVPAVNSTVTVNVEYTAWVSVNQIVFISGAGYYEVTGKTLTSLTIRNLGYSGNLSSGTISTGAILTTTGIKGLDGISSTTTTTASFTQPLIGNTVTISVADSRWISIGQDIYIEGAGAYTVTNVTSQTSIQIRNNGADGNVSNGLTIPTNSQVSPGGKTGQRGTNAIVTVLGTSFTQPAVNSDRTITVGTTEFLSVGSYIFISGGGFYKVQSITNATQLVIRNIGDDENVNAGVTVPSGVILSPSGRPGTNGINGINGTNGIDGVDGQGIDHIELTSSVANIDTYTIWGDAAETINLGTFDVVNGVDGINGQDGATGATGSVNAAASLSLDHQTTDPTAIVGKLVLYSMLDGLYYRQPDDTINKLLVEGDIGTSIGNLISLVDVNGQPGLPAIDGSQLLNLPQGGHTIQDEGVSLTKRENLNFKGDLVNVSDNVDTTDVTIDSGLTNLGDILYHDGSGLAPLAKGTNGQILASDDVNGLTWIDAPTGSGTGTFDSPTTTKGDLIVRGETEDTRLPVGAENTFLSPDPNSPTGLTWKNPVLGRALTIKDEGIALVERPSINFTGELVSVSDNSGADSTDVVINLPNTIDLGIWTP